MNEARQIVEVSDAWSDLGPALRSGYVKPQQQPSGKTLRIISDLGLRYPPRGTVDEQDHAARVLLLAKDCADVHPDWLEAAAEEWAKSSPFFPRACELRDKALAIGRLRTRGQALPPPEHRPREPVPPAPPLTDDEIRKLPRAFIELGIKLGDIDPERAARLRPPETDQSTQAGE